MTENPKLEEMDFDNLSSNCEVGGGKLKGQKISVSDIASTKSDSFVVDMERVSHLMEKDTNNSSSGITLQRNLSRKLGSVRNAETKITSNIGETTATLHGSSTPEKTRVVPVGAIDHFHHHQITITDGSTTNGVATESKCAAKRFSFRRTTRNSDPRRILIFFATLSSMGTILLIYFTLSMGKFKGDYNSSI